MILEDVHRPLTAFGIQLEQDSYNQDVIILDGMDSDSIYAGNPLELEDNLVDEGALVKAAQGAEKVGGAIKKGIKVSKKSHIVIMASDLETNPKNLKKMITVSKKNPSRIICASRWLKHGKINNYTKS